jgi:hypothetical protein
MNLEKDIFLVNPPAVYLTPLDYGMFNLKMGKRFICISPQRLLGRALNYIFIQGPVILKE